ncbi:MAG: hypothetical protein NZM31_09315 [Gemmatales bacterium]|nr:hypothetical protein [Gemmatales bacterium]MDW8387192.1 DUF6580 family putative transport protein [Gemmatales bacterium]
MSRPVTSFKPMYRILVVSSMIAVAVAARLLPHPPNFAPIGAVALFAGAAFADRRLAFAVPLAAMILSDLFLHVHELLPVVYGSFALSVILGRFLRGRRRFLPTTAMTLLGSLQFFLITNFGCWLLYYPHTWPGLTECYIAALPFFRNSVLGDLFYVGLLFGGLAVLERTFSVLREPIPEQGVGVVQS